MLFKCQRNYPTEISLLNVADFECLSSLMHHRHGQHHLISRLSHHATITAPSKQPLQGLVIFRQYFLKKSYKYQAWLGWPTYSVEKYIYISKLAFTCLHSRGKMRQILKAGEVAAVIMRSCRTFSVRAAALFL